MISDSDRSFDRARHPSREKGRDLFLQGAFVEELISLAPYPERVLVFGGGDGKEVVALRRAYPDAKVYSIDLSAPEIDSAKENPNLHGALIRADWDHPPLCDETFDLAVFFAAIHHSSNLTRTMKIVGKLLRSGGWVYATHEPMASLLFGGVQKRRMAAIARREGGVESSPSQREYLEALTAAGFVSVRIASSRLNLVRLEKMDEGFEDVRVRRSDWPERATRLLLAFLSFLSAERKLTILFGVQRIAFGLFGVTLIGRKP